MGKTLLIDGNSLGYANHNMNPLTVGGKQIQAVFGMTKQIRNLRQAFPGADILVMWDGKAQWRYDLLPEYKGKREDDPKKVAMREAYREQRPLIGKMLKLVGVKQVVVSNQEADDLAGYFVKTLGAKPDNEIVLVTGDQDWLQLIQRNVSWYDPRQDGKWVTFNAFTDKTGFLTQEAFLQGKALAGDTSDCIPPTAFRGIGEKSAPVFLAEFGSVDNFFRMVDSGEFVPKKAAHVKLAMPEAREAFRRNMRLMNLLDVKKPEPDKVTVVRGDFDEAGFKRFCEDLQFHSLLRDFHTFTKPFVKE